MHLSSEELYQALSDWAANGPSDADIEAEAARTQSVLTERKIRFAHTLHPLLRDYCLTEFGLGTPLCQAEREDICKVTLCLVRMYDLRRQAGDDDQAYERKLAEAALDKDFTPGAKRLFDQHRAAAFTVGSQFKDAFQHLMSMPWSYGQELEQQAIHAFWEKYGSADLQYQAAYELSRLSAAGLPAPFQWDFDPFCTAPVTAAGWAGYNRCLSGIEIQGVGFQIEKRCFDGRDAQLYYFNNDSWPASDDEAVLDTIRRFSSGLVDVHIEQRVTTICRRTAKRNLIVFRLSPDAIRPTVRINREDVDASILGGYVFVLPRSGEFWCELGEIRDGELIPLYQDAFCMK